MEYFKFDYSIVKTRGRDYEQFVSSGHPYKQYLFDLGLIQFDKELDWDYRNKAKNILNLQKILFFVPYPVILLSLIYLKRRNYFAQNTIYDREYKTVFHFFFLVIATRATQKYLLKYQSDELLKEVHKIKNI